MYKKGSLVYIEGICDRCGDNDLPVTFYARTKEWLCEPDLNVRKRAVLARKKLREEEKMKDRWDEVTAP